MAAKLIKFDYRIGVYFLVFSTAPTFAQIAVPAFDPEIDQVIASSPLVGYRTLSGNSVIQLAPDDPRNIYIGWHGPGIALPTAVFVGSAKRNPLLAEVLVMSGKDPESARFEEWYQAACSTSLPPVLEPGPTVIEISDAAIGTVYADMDFVSRLPKTELLDCSEPKLFSIETELGGVDLLALNPSWGATFQESYFAVNAAESEPWDAYWSTLEISASMRGTPRLEEAATFIDGMATFGRPTVYTHKEAKLDVPTSIQEKYDVYAVYFAASFRDLDPNNFKTFSFGVAPQDESVALDLIPLRFDGEARVTETSALPSMKVGPIEIGSPYQKQVVFSVLKPKVIAYGLQERDFSWSVIDDAMQLGSMRFVAILGVPQGLATLRVMLYAMATYKETWYAQGGTIQTAPLPTTLKLRPQ